MVIMMGVTLLMVLLVPKMQLDPEQMKEMREMQAKANEDTPSWLQNLMAPPQSY
jgi:hypothetical protein